MCGALAALHNTDVVAVGLQGYGSPNQYCARQLKRWGSQYQASVTHVQPDVQRLMAWLQAHIPAADAFPSR
jgi:aminoglycoside phosphotransferase (APT) family kinase protein